MSEDTNFQEQLLQAPPNAPTAADAEAAKVAQQAQIASALSTNTDPNRPAQSGFETPVAAVAPGGPAPGSVGFKLANAFKAQKAAGPGGPTETHAFFSGVTDALFGSTDWKTAQANADATKPSAAPMQMPKKGLFGNVFNALRDAQAMNTNPNAIPDRKRQEMTDQIAMAHANSQMLHDQILVHKMGEDAILASVETGKQGYNAIKNADQPGTDVAKDVDSDEIKHMIDTHQFNPSEDTAFLTGRKLTGKDANGIPLYRSTYSVIKPHGPVDLTDKDEELDKIKKYTGRDLRSEDGKKVTKVPAGVYNQLWQQVQTAETNERAARVTEAVDDKNRKIIDEAQNSDAAKKMWNSNTLTKATAANTVASKDGSRDPFAVIKTYDYLMTHKEDRDQVIKETGASNFSEAYMQYAGGEPYFKGLREDLNKATAKNKDTIHDMLQTMKTKPQEAEGKVPSFEAGMRSIINAPKDAPDITDQDRKDAQASLGVLEDIKQGEIDLDKAKAEGKKEAAKGYQGDENAATPEAFLASLKPAEQATVKTIGEGRAGDLNLAYLISRKPEVFDAVALAYPGFDKAKIGKYVTASKEYASLKPGTPGAALNSGNAVLGHLERLKEIADTHPAKVRIHGSDSNLAYNTLLNTIVGELTTFYQDPKTNETLKGFKDNLSTFVGSRDAQIKEQIKAMGVKMDSYENSWKEAAPSEAYEAPMPKMTPHAYQIMVENDPEYAARHPEKVSATETQKQPANNAPAGATHKVPGPDGKMHWTNAQGTVDYGVAQ